MSKKEKELYKLSRFEVYDKVERLIDEFPDLNTISEKEENIRRREELLSLL